MPYELHSAKGETEVSEGYSYPTAKNCRDYLTVPALNKYFKTSKSFNFTVRTAGTAYIIFKTGENYYAVGLGDNLHNDHCSTYHSAKRQKIVMETTPNLVNSEEFHGYWVKLKDDVLLVGRANEEEPFIKWDDPKEDLKRDDLKICFYTVMSNGTWIVNDDDFPKRAMIVRMRKGYYGTWIPAAGGNVPPGSFPFGSSDDEEHYIARAEANNVLTPGKLIPSTEKCHVIGDDDIIYARTNYEVLCTIRPLWSWMKCTDEFPEHAVKSFCRKTKTLYYIGRLYKNTSLLIGKVDSKEKLCHIDYLGHIFKAKEYEILTSRDTVDKDSDINYYFSRIELLSGGSKSKGASTSKSDPTSKSESNDVPMVDVQHKADIESEEYDSDL